MEIEEQTVQNTKYTIAPFNNKWEEKKFKKNIQEL